MLMVHVVYNALHRSADSFFVNLIGGIVLLSLACLSCVGGAIAVFVSS